MTVGPEAPIIGTQNNPFRAQRSLAGAAPRGQTQAMIGSLKQEPGTEEERTAEELQTPTKSRCYLHPQPTFSPCPFGSILDRSLELALYLTLPHQSWLPSFRACKYNYFLSPHIPSPLTHTQNACKASSIAASPLKCMLNRAPEYRVRMPRYLLNCIGIAALLVLVCSSSMFPFFSLLLSPWSLPRSTQL